MFLYTQDTYHGLYKYEAKHSFIIYQTPETKGMANTIWK